MALEAEFGLEVLGNLPDQTLEGKLADQQLRGLLVPADLAESHCARPEPVRLLDTTSAWSTFALSLRSQLLIGSPSSRRFAGCLLGAGHFLGLKYRNEKIKSFDCFCLGCNVCTCLSTVKHIF
jgi:hypothetical protein